MYTLCLLLTLCMCSVNKEQDVRTVEEFYAEITDNEFKVSMDFNMDLSWTSGDEISVFRNASTNEKYRFTGNTGDYAGAFSKVDDNAANATFSKYYAIYPYNSSISCSSEGVFNIDYPEVQAYSSPRLVSGIVPMIASTSSLDDNNLRFRNMCGFLKVTLSGEGNIKSIVIKGNNGEKLAGKATVKLDEDGVPDIEFVRAAATKVTVDMGDGVELDGTAKSFYVVLPPVVFSNGITLTVNDVDSRVFVKKSSAELRVARSSVKPMAELKYAPTISEINGTKILAGNNIVGLISDKQTGNGIAGVPVSDGYKFTVTDANGVYQMAADPLCRYVFYTLPAEYKTTLDEDHCPRFFSKGKIDLEIVNRNDFVLERKTVDETNWTFIGISDPQPDESNDVVRFVNESIPDIQSTLNTAQANGKYKNAYAITLGDLTSSVPALHQGMKNAMSNVQLADGRYLPFYQCTGNHDHNTAPTIYESVNEYISFFGPTEYSFNIGKAHIVVVDNILFKNWKATGDNNDYTCGLTDGQYQWLLQDLSYVQNKEDKVIFYVCHAPFMSAPGDRDHVQLYNHYADVLNQLAQFHDAHILSGHSHRWCNYLHKSYLCKSGRPVYEHNQNAVGGWCWLYGYMCPDGSPQGYCIYDVRGNEVYDWVAKTTLKDADYQMRVYNGNQVFTDANSTKYSWTDTYLYPKYAKADFKNSFIVSLWGGDDTHWTLDLYINGTKYGTLTKVYTIDMCAQSYFKGRFVGYADDAQHFWYIKTPGNVDPTTVTNWEIRATQTVPSSANVKHTYRCSVLQTDYSGFAPGTSSSAGGTQQIGVSDYTGGWN